MNEEPEVVEPTYFDDIRQVIEDCLTSFVKEGLATNNLRFYDAKN